MDIMKENFAGALKKENRIKFDSKRRKQSEVLGYTLTGQNDIKVETLHGNQSQANRLKALNKFQSGQSTFLVATDIVSRGIDVEGITHVIIYELPNEPESYIHRIGRTARAGASGIAISFCDAGECGYLRKIERTINFSLIIKENHPFHSSVIASKFKNQQKKD